MTIEAVEPWNLSFPNAAAAAQNPDCLMHTRHGLFFTALASSALVFESLPVRRTKNKVIFLGGGRGVDFPPDLF